MVSSLNMRTWEWRSLCLGKSTSTEAHSRRLGLIFNVNYTYDRRYFADFLERLRGSSKFEVMIVRHLSFSPGWDGTYIMKIFEFVKCY